jgi:hypothetical protein
VVQAAENNHDPTNTCIAYPAIGSGVGYAGRGVARAGATLSRQAWLDAGRAAISDVQQILHGSHATNEPPPTQSTLTRRHPTVYCIPPLRCRHCSFSSALLRPARLILIPIDTDIRRPARVPHPLRRATTQHTSPSTYPASIDTAQCQLHTAQRLPWRPRGRRRPRATPAAAPWS